LGTIFKGGINMQITFDCFFDEEVADKLIKKAVEQNTSVAKIIKDFVNQGLNENKSKKEGFDQGVSEMLKMIQDIAPGMLQ
jgi:hypothetical protein